MNKKKFEAQREVPKPLNRDEILSEAPAIPNQEVIVPGFSRPISMQNVSFERMIELRTQATTPAEYNTMLVAECCVALEVEDAYKLQKNGTKFAMLFNAVNQYLGADLDQKVGK